METLIITFLLSFAFGYLLWENSKLQKILKNRETMYEQLRSHFYMLQSDYVELMRSKEDKTQIIDK